MMTTNVKGKTVEEAETLVQEFRDMATGKLNVQKQPNHLGRLAVFEGVKDLPSRVKCAILPWHTLHAAFNSMATTTTENEEEPMKSAGVTI
jgi:nitrogen fixation NifU-like protein